MAQVDETTDVGRLLGIQLNDKRNRVCQPDADIAADGSAAHIRVIRTREELMIACETHRVIASGA